jgi:hypothetical protein
MKTHRALAAVAVLCALLALAALEARNRRAISVNADEVDALQSVGWMAGDWETRDATTYVEEHWTRPAGGAMLGNSRAIRDGKMTEFEFLRIEARRDGVFYMPQPAGQPAVDFKFTPTTKDEAVFVNPGHADHLKRIIYRRNADGTLMARIEGESNGKNFAKDWHYFPQKK